jgi:hypothetical protein
MIIYDNLPFLLGLLRVLMTFPRANKLRFIFAPSIYRIPLFSDKAALSLPAKSF